MSVALVTGAAKRLGKVISVELAKNGWNVAIHYKTSELDAIKTANLCRQHGAKAECFKADLEKEHECRDLIAQVTDHFGDLNAIINSASEFSYDNIYDLKQDLANRHWKVNTIAPLLLSKELFKIFSRKARLSNDQEADNLKGQGCVINILDQKLWNPNPDYLSYSLSKAALRAATDVLALSMAPWVRVIGIAPGLTLSSPRMDEATFYEFHKMTPLRRGSTPEEIASIIRHALLNRSLNGVNILADSGQHLVRLDRDFPFLTSTSINNLNKS